MRLLAEINSKINRSIARDEDQRLYGERDVWALPLASGLRRGDCEDYVLEKRQALVAAGVPPEALSIAVAKGSAGRPHAVLLVATSGGDLVLDNLTPWIQRWDRTSYRWLQRQVPGQPQRWAYVESSAGAETTLPAPAG